MSKHLLFLSHEASRTGAPFMLLHLLRWLKANSDLTWEVIFAEDGELIPEFAALSPVTVWNKKRSVLQKAEGRVRRRLLGETLPDEWHNQPSRETARQIVEKGADLIYSNTVANGPMLDALSDLRCPVICHAHELEYIIVNSIGKKNFELSNARTDHYIAASHAVKKNLMRSHAVPDERIDVVHEFVPTKMVSSEQISRARKEICRELGIASETKIVMGAGTLDWRKGNDLWVQMAVLVSRLSSIPVHFVWVGGYSNKDIACFQHDLAQADIKERVHFMGVRSNIVDYFAACDVFAMTSREDPYPLVNLEVAAVGKPIVCFDGGGGTPEFVEEDCGFSVPYLDVREMAERVVELLNAPEMCQRMGSCATQKVRQRHDVDVSAPQILSVIERCLVNAS